MIKETLFNAKVLLFGEYGIIKDSMGLSIPYNFYKGKLKVDDEISEDTTKSNLSLTKFYIHLASLQASGELEFNIDLKAFKADLEKGMHFDSSIPQGFGVGSSGALCAAIYDRYATDKIDPEENIHKDNILKLKSIFGQMESYFHGKSSGLDPLICYLNLPVLIKSKTDVDTVGMPAQKEGSGAIFLLNSGKPGETEPMVNIFMEKMKQEGFRAMLKDQFTKYNDACIQAFLKGDTKPLFNNLKKLSKLVLENFSPMIPNTFHKLWQQGIDSNAYYLKLCGSGGGGFVLGFTQDMPKAKQLLKSHDIEVIYKF